MTAPVPPSPIAVGLIGLAERSDEDLLRLLTSEGQQAVIVAALATYAQKIHDLEDEMALTDEKIASITANLQNIQGDVARLNELTPQLTAEVSRLRGELEAQDPELAAKLQPLEELSKQIADATPDPVEVPADEEPAAPADEVSDGEVARSAEVPGQR